MAEGRMLKRLVATSKRLAALQTDGARLLWTWMIPFLDIKGRLSADPYVLKGMLFPRIGATTPEMIAIWLDDLEHVGLIARYSVDTDLYLLYRNFTDHQILRADREARSHIPPPPKGLTYQSWSTPGPTPGELPPKLMECNVMECNVMEGKLNPSPPTPHTRAAQKSVPDPRVKILVDYHFTKWAKAYPGKNYILDAPKEPVALKRLLAQVDGLAGTETIDAVAAIQGWQDAYFASEDLFIRNSGHSISLFCKVINKLQLPPTANESNNMRILRRAWERARKQESEVITQ